jgi:hypothetical protein
MQDANTFLDAGWDFVGETTNGGSDDWAMPAGGGYPVLWYQLPVAPDLPTFAGGSGTAGDPYLIETEGQLNRIGHNPRLMDKHFRLISDLDMKGLKYYMIADRPYAFSGTFDGADRTISNILVEPLFMSSMSSIGFIGGLKGPEASIQNLTLTDPNVVSEWGWGVGALTGLNENGTVTNCHAVNANVVGLLAVGGLVGGNIWYGRISGCSATGDVSENTFMSLLFSAVGGLVGENTFWAQIDNSCAKCDVSGDDCVGGLVGSNVYGILTNCYSQGTVTGTERSIGGLIGRNLGNNEANYCYSSSIVTGPAGPNAVGGFVGQTGGGSESYTACFWDATINPLLPGIGDGNDPNVIGETTENMQTKTTFTDAGWDFVDEIVNGTDDIWDICEGTNYPKLDRHVPTPGDFVCPDGVEMGDFAILSAQWMQPPGEPSADIAPDAGDGIVDWFDLEELADNWLAGL